MGTRHVTLTMDLSAKVCKWVPANLILGGDAARSQFFTIRTSQPANNMYELVQLYACISARSADL